SLAAAPRAESLALLGQAIEPGQTYRLPLPVGDSVGGETSTPVLVVAGAQTERVVCLTGGIHGDELNGVEVVRRSLAHARPAQLRGVLVGVPVVNLAALRRGPRHPPDPPGPDPLFPGNPPGRPAPRPAHPLPAGPPPP